MSKHTPGEWSCDRNEHTIISRHGIKIYSICDIHEVPTIFHGDTTEANARLIAAAPDLLDACQEVWLLDRMGRLDLPEESRQMIRHAIAKATEGDR